MLNRLKATTSLVRAVSLWKYREEITRTKVSNVVLVLLLSTVVTQSGSKSLCWVHTLPSLMLLRKVKKLVKLFNCHPVNIHV